MLNILTYNTHLFDGIGGDFGSLALPLFDEQERLNNIIAFLQSDAVSADVVGLTEVWSNNNKRRIIEALSSSKYPHFHFENSSSENLGDGLLLLSRFPLLNAQFEAFKANDSSSAFGNFGNAVQGFFASEGFDRFSQKGFISSKIAVGDQQVLCILTHTQSGEKTEEKDKRNNHLAQIRDHIRNVAIDPNQAVVLMGDLNVVAENQTGEATAEYSTVLLPLMEEVGLKDTFRSVNPDANQTPGFTFDGQQNLLVQQFDKEEANARQRLDYIFSSAHPLTATAIDNLKYESPTEQKTMDISDHYPLKTSLSLSQLSKAIQPSHSAYRLVIRTKDKFLAGTDADIFLKMWGENGKTTDEIRLNGLLSGNIFEQGDVDIFTIERGGLGRIVKLSLRSSGNDDWEVDTVVITNPNGEETTFDFNKIINQDTPLAETTIDANGFPEQVNISIEKDFVSNESQFYVLNNEANEEKEESLAIQLNGAEQIEITPHMVRGNTLPDDLHFDPLSKKTTEWSRPVKVEWDKALADKRIQKGSHSFEVVESKAVKLPPESLYFAETKWKIRKKRGIANWGGRKFGLQWVAEEPKVESVEEHIFKQGEATKIPFRFLHYLKQNNLLQKTNGFKFMQSPAIRFDGQNDFATADSICTFLTTPSLSFGCWAKPETSTNPDGTLLAFNTSSGGNRNMIGFDAKAQVFFYFDPENGYQKTGGRFRFDSWYHVFVCINAEDQGILYVNGEPLLRFKTRIRPQLTGRFSIGQEWDTNTPSDLFKGQIADIRIWNRTFTDREVRGQIGHRLAKNNQGLVAYWPVIEEKGKVLREVINGHHAELRGGQWELDTDLHMSLSEEVRSI